MPDTALHPEVCEPLYSAEYARNRTEAAIREADALIDRMDARERRREERLDRERREDRDRLARYGRQLDHAKDYVEAALDRLDRGRPDLARIHLLALLREVRG